MQWEDFAKDAAFAVIDRYRDKLPSFNDDIQGTGAVALAGIVNACRLRKEALRDQRVIVHGAGAGGIGVASAIQRGMMREGLTETQAAERIFVLDSKGLLTRDRDVEPYKRPFAQAPGRVASKSGVPTLLETVRGARATILVGLSGQPGSFDEASIRAMAENTARPVVFPLSNPTSSVEVEPARVFAWTGGRAIVATGSPFDPVEVEGRPVEIGQGNNAFIFPGLGQGAILAEARAVTDGMVLEASYALAEYTAEKYPDAVYPPIADLQAVSHVRVAARVIERAAQDGVAQVAPRSPRGDRRDGPRALLKAPALLAHRPRLRRPQLPRRRVSAGLIGPAVGVERRCGALSDSSSSRRVRGATGRWTCLRACGGSCEDFGCLSWRLALRSNARAASPSWPRNLRTFSLRRRGRAPCESAPCECPVAPRGLPAAHSDRRLPLLPSEAGLLLFPLPLARSRRPARKQRAEQALSRSGDLRDRVFEDHTIATRRGVGAADFPHELKRSGLDLVRRRRGLEVVKDPDVAAHENAA